MSGLCGFVACGGKEIPKTALIRRMCGALARRGPDEEDIYISPGIGLGYLHLASSGCMQPLSDASGRFVIVHDGHIANGPQLRQELEFQGAVFHTSSGAEVLLHGLIRHGINFLHSVNGVFAFALWDAEESKLLLARDRFGVKPLYWSFLPGRGVLFGSEASAIIAVEQDCARLDMHALGLYLALSYIPGEQSIYSPIKRLLPGFSITVKGGGEPETSAWWDLAANWGKVPPCKEDEALEYFTELFDDAVRLRLGADTSVGALLSSGIDSASVVSSMTRYMPGVRTFSAAFRDRSHNEAPQAAECAKFLGTQHIELLVDDSAERILLELSEQLDEPFADTSIIPMHILCAKTKEHVNIVLTGDGGDELLAGYTTLRADALYPWIRRLPAGVVSALRFAAGMVPEHHAKVSFSYKLKQFLGAYPKSVEDAHAWWRMLFSPERLQALFPLLPHADAAFMPFREAYGRGESLSRQDRFLLTDYCTWLPFDCATKADRASMNNGLEIRSPFLDHRLVEFCTALPPHWKRIGDKGKIILYKAMRDRVPAQVLQRRKLGFNAPVSAWLVGQWRQLAEDMFSDGNLKQYAFLHAPTIRTLWREHACEGKDHGFRLFTILMFLLWLQKHDMQVH
ncbi:asparagine synthase (glutamine-hydrolyzing) [Desulfovibrio sp. OttesenSCG-928-G11]|nr:asparagine synthase (glutamine-hydrolyzing) [Desulfovibrio sp. OttesenSCG-928-G11]